MNWFVSLQDFTVRQKSRKIYAGYLLKRILAYKAAAFFVKRDTLRAARFFGMILPTAFMILLSALRTAVIAAALSPDSIATNAFLVAVLTALRRDVLIAFFFAVTKILFSDDL